MIRAKRQWTAAEKAAIHTTNNELVKIIEEAQVRPDIACAALHMLAVGYAYSYDFMTLEESIENHKAMWADLEQQRKARMA